MVQKSAPREQIQTLGRPGNQFATLFEPGGLALKLGLTAAIDTTKAEIGGKEWKLAEVTMPHCHVANPYQESALDGGIRRKTEASGGKLYRHVANSLAGRGKVTVEGSSKGRKTMSAAGQGAGSIRLAAPPFHQPAAPCCHFPHYSTSARQTSRAGPGT